MVNENRQVPADAITFTAGVVDAPAKNGKQTGQPTHLISRGEPAPVSPVIGREDTNRHPGVGQAPKVLLARQAGGELAAVNASTGKGSRDSQDHGEGAALGSVHDPLLRQDGGSEPPHGPRKEGLGSPDRDPLRGARAILTAYVGDQEIDSIMMNGLEERLLELELEAMEEKDKVPGTNVKASREYRETKAKYGAVQSANVENTERAVTEELARADDETMLRSDTEAACAYSHTMGLGSHVFRRYYQGLPTNMHGPTEGSPAADKDEFFRKEGAWLLDLGADLRRTSIIVTPKEFFEKRDEHTPEFLAGWAQIYDRRIAAAWVARQDLQRHREKKIEAAESARPLQEVSGKLRDRKEDTRTLYNKAEDLMRNNAVAADGGMIVPLDGDEEFSENDLACIIEGRTLHFDSITVNHAGEKNPVTYTDVNIRAVIEHPYGEMPTFSNDMPEEGELSALRMNSIEMVDPKGNIIHYSLVKTIKDGQVEYTIEPTDKGQGFGTHIFSEFPGSDRVKLNEVLTALNEQGLAGPKEDLKVAEKNGTPDELLKQNLERILAEEQLDAETLEAIIATAREFSAANLIHKYRDLEKRSPEDSELQDAQIQLEEALDNVPDVDNPTYDRARMIYLALIEDYLTDTDETGTEASDLANTEAAMQGAATIQEHLGEVLADRQTDTDQAKNLLRESLGVADEGESLEPTYVKLAQEAETQTNDLDPYSDARKALLSELVEKKPSLPTVKAVTDWAMRDETRMSVHKYRDIERRHERTAAEGPDQDLARADTEYRTAQAQVIRRQIITPSGQVIDGEQVYEEARQLYESVLPAYVAAAIVSLADVQGISAQPTDLMKTQTLIEASRMLQRHLHAITRAHFQSSQPEETSETAMRGLRAKKRQEFERIHQTAAEIVRGNPGLFVRSTEADASTTHTNLKTIPAILLGETSPETSIPYFSVTHSNGQTTRYDDVILTAEVRYPDRATREHYVLQSNPVPPESEDPHSVNITSLSLTDIDHPDHRIKYHFEEIRPSGGKIEYRIRGEIINIPDNLTVPPMLYMTPGERKRLQEILEKIKEITE